jgi:cytochrome c oxidase subunit II
VVRLTPLQDHTVVSAASTPVSCAYGNGRSRFWYSFAPCALLLNADAGQSALAPAGLAAERLSDLSLWMFAGGVFIWAGFIALAFYAFRARPESRTHHRANRLIVVGGAIVPTVVLGLLLVYGLALLSDLVAPAPKGSLSVEVSGEQWWWRVRYRSATGSAVELANEIRLPVGQAAEFVLVSPDVIHSFWIPSLGGKMDMTPGRVNRLTLQPSKAGVFRGVCAEYCGTAHALMAFRVVVLSNDEFARWLDHQSQPAHIPADTLSNRGQELFLANGCGACHTIRGSPADGVVGPDLTHVGSRLSLGADKLPNERDKFVRWIAHTKDEKPGVHMPAFNMLTQQDLEAVAVYLDGLE